MIGVIGGNGVAATNKLCQLVEELVVKAGGFRDSHHPEMLIWQATQVPSRSMYLEGRGESFIPGYVEIGKKLKSCGCDELCMCCNTAHYYIDELEDKIGLPIVNLIKLVALKTKELGSRRVGLMCSDGLTKVKFYDSVFSKVYPKVKIIYPSIEYQALVTRGICNAKNIERYSGSGNLQNPTKCFSASVEHLIECGADSIIAGCTDINSVFNRSSAQISGLNYIDSLEVLAEYIASKNTNLP